MKRLKIIPVILCGGSGSRLWPLSRKSFPKQYLSLINNSKLSLLQETVLRIQELKNIEIPIFVCNEEHRFLVAEQMREINISPRSIILEPYSKNTCPAIALAALKANEQEEDSILLVLSSDHLIKEKEKFLDSISQSIQIALIDKLVTFGIIPTSPETGYGYIQSEKSSFFKEVKSFKIKKFIEKPDINLAKKLIADSSYTWNSGMFVFKTSTILNEINKYEPEILENCKNSLKMGFEDLDFQRLNKEIFKDCKESSFDVSIMENTSNGIVMQLDAKWSDIGSWKSLWENEPKDKDGNVVSGKVLTFQVKNTYLRSENRLVIANEIEDLIIVDTNDAILISKKESSQNIKNIVSDLVDRGFSEAIEHKRIYRPWGNYISVADDLGWQVKRIEVKPGGKLSMQMHHHRAEHWVIVKGIAEVTIRDKVSILQKNQSTYIPLGTKHRLANPGNSLLVLIEVQSGDYLGEDDIVRFKDEYGRN